MSEPNTLITCPACNDDYSGCALCQGVGQVTGPQVIQWAINWYRMQYGHEPEIPLSQKKQEGYRQLLNSPAAKELGLNPALLDDTPEGKAAREKLMRFNALESGEIIETDDPESEPDRPTATWGTKCIWCNGSGFTQANMMCRICHGSGKR